MTDLSQAQRFSSSRLRKPHLSSVLTLLKKTFPPFSAGGGPFCNRNLLENKCIFCHVICFIFNLWREKMIRYATLLYCKVLCDSSLAHYAVKCGHTWASGCLHAHSRRIFTTPFGWLEFYRRLSLRLTILHFHYPVCPLLLPLLTHSQGWRWGVLADRVLFCPLSLECEDWGEGVRLRFQTTNNIWSFFTNTIPGLFVSYKIFISICPLSNLLWGHGRPGGCEGRIYL